jgi:hypothetical protein
MLVFRNNYDKEANEFLFRSSDKFLKELGIVNIKKINTEMNCLNAFKLFFSTPTLANMSSVFTTSINFSYFTKYSKKFASIYNVDNNYLIRFILKKFFSIVLLCDLPDYSRLHKKLYDDKKKSLRDQFDTVFANTLRNSLECSTFLYTFFEDELKFVFKEEDVKIIAAKMNELEKVFSILNVNTAKIYQNIKAKSRGIRTFKNNGLRFPFDSYTFSRKIKKSYKVKDTDLAKNPVLCNFSYDPGRSIIASIGIREILLEFNNNLHYQPEKFVEKTGEINKLILNQQMPENGIKGRYNLFKDEDILDILTYTATRKDKVRVFISKSY